MDQKTFLLGVGCQRGGTTWLHRYLASHPNVDPGFAKEYHVFNVTYLQQVNFANDWISSIQKVINNNNLTKNVDEAFKKLAFVNDDSLYFDYFNGLYHNNTETWLVGDITPAYSGLPRSAFEHIKANLHARGFNVRVVFLMRDPFDRTLSWVRYRLMNTKNNSDSVESQNHHEVDEEKDLLSLYASKGNELRTRYDMTISNMERVFSADEIKYIFYEEFFNYDMVRSLTDFLGLPFRDPDLKARENAAATDPLISEATRRKVVSHFRSTYETVAERFGPDRVRRIWPNMAYLEA